MLRVELLSANNELRSFCYALNDAVVSNGSVSRIVDMELSEGGNPVTTYRADGLIVATPTGSTAYSMSAGGPVIDTGLDCISVTPICAHSLRCRPIVFSGDSVFEVRCKADPYHAKLSLDGEETCDLADGDKVIVKKSEYVTRLVRVGEGSFCNILYRKMSDI
jgi:NAD+ kinase